MKTIHCQSGAILPIERDDVPDHLDHYQFRGKPCFIKLMGIVYFLWFSLSGIQSQQVFSLRQCLEFAISNNHDLRKAQYDKEKAAYARQEILGSLLPQISGSASLNDNLKKAKFIMPNFINDMLPPQAQDPNARKYMTIEMGTNYNANLGVSLNQQVLNFSLFNMLEIAKIAEKMANLGVAASDEEIIYQTAILFYSVQSTEYAVDQLGNSIELVRRMLKTMEVNHVNGLVKKVDVDRLKVNLVNLTTQQSTVKSAAEAQKNLLKLQMGFEMNVPLEIQPINLALFEEKAGEKVALSFSIENQTPYRLLMENANMMEVQRKSAIYENLPTLSLVFNYQYNGVSDEFFRGETNYWYPSSIIGLNLRAPVFSGFSRRARLRQASLEILKTREDAAMLEQSLNMAYQNARMKLDDAGETIALQRDNQALAEEVLKIAENNFELGLSSMSDILNASQSLVQAQLSYASALNDYMKAWIDLNKSGGNIRYFLAE